MSGTVLINNVAFDMPFDEMTATNLLALHKSTWPQNHLANSYSLTDCFTGFLPRNFMPSAAAETVQAYAVRLLGLGIDSTFVLSRLLKGFPLNLTLSQLADLNACGSEWVMITREQEEMVDTEPVRPLTAYAPYSHRDLSVTVMTRTAWNATKVQKQMLLQEERAAAALPPALPPQAEGRGEKRSRELVEEEEQVVEEIQEQQKQPQEFIAEAPEDVIEIVSDAEDEIEHQEQTTKKKQKKQNHTNDEIDALFRTLLNGKAWAGNHDINIVMFRRDLIKGNGNVACCYIGQKKFLFDMYDRFGHANVSGMFPTQKGSKDIGFGVKIEFETSADLNMFHQNHKTFKAELDTLWTDIFPYYVMAADGTDESVTLFERKLASARNKAANGVPAKASKQQQQQQKKQPPPAVYEDVSLNFPMAPPRPTGLLYPVTSNPELVISESFQH